MSRGTRYVLSALFALALIGAPYWYHELHEARFRNFRVVTPGVLYRSGQLDAAGFRRIVEEHGIRTVVNLRERNRSGTGAPDEEEDYCADRGIVFVRIGVLPWRGRNSSPPALQPVRQFLEIMQNPARFPRPVLIHCFAGIHRTGAYCALYRIECQHWSAPDAVEEMRRCGYSDPEEDLLEFIRNFRPSWKEQPGPLETSRRRKGATQGPPSIPQD
jgi:protein tyrosine/serine phosphatase